MLNKEFCVDLSALISAMTKNMSDDDLAESVAALENNPPADTAKNTPETKTVLAFLEKKKASCFPCDKSIYDAAIQLLCKTKALEEEKQDSLELLHSYRHICGEHTPDELSRLVQADDDGRCLVIPFKIGQTVRHKTEKWIGQVDEITLNNEGLMLFVSSGGYTGYYPPDVLEKITDASKKTSTALTQLFKDHVSGPSKPFVIDFSGLDMPLAPEIFCGPERHSLHCYRTCAMLADEIKRLTEQKALLPEGNFLSDSGEEIDYRKLIRDLQNGCKENCADCDYSEGIEYNCTLSKVCAQALEALLNKKE